VDSDENVTEVVATEVLLGAKSPVVGFDRITDDLRLEIMAWCDTFKQIKTCALAAPDFARQIALAKRKLTDRRRYGGGSDFADQRKRSSKALPIQLRIERPPPLPQLKQLSSESERTLDLVVVGPQRAGKSTLVRRLAQLGSRQAKLPTDSSKVPGLRLQYRPTIGPGALTCLTVITARGENILVNVRDTAGAAEFGICVASCVAHASNPAMLVVFNLADNKSLESAKQSYERMLAVLPHKPMPTVFCGMQCDREEERQVPWCNPAAWATNRGLNYIELSSYTDENVAEVVATLISAAA